PRLPAVRAGGDPAGLAHRGAGGRDRRAVGPAWAAAPSVGAGRAGEDVVILLADELPLVDEAVSEDDDSHIFCCDPDRALCGADLTGMRYIGDDPNEPADCIRCEDIWDAGVPC